MTNLAICINQWDAPQLALIKQQIAPGCTDDELALFGLVCKQTKLDPFLRQIYAISRYQWNAVTKTSEPKMTIQISIDGYRIMAARTGRHLCTAISWCGPDGHWLDIWLSDMPPAAAKAEIWVKGSDRPFVAIAKFNSYKQTDKNGNLTGNWQKMPELMIGNAAEKLGIRMAFPGEFANDPEAAQSPTYDMAEVNAEVTDIIVEPEAAELVSEEEAEIAGFKAQAKNLFKWCKLTGSDRAQWALDLHGCASTNWNRDQWEIAVAELQGRWDLISSLEQSEAA